MKPKLNARFILKTVANFYKLEIERFSSDCKKADIVKARQVYIYLSHLYTGLNYREIGEIINRKHSYAMYSVDKIQTQRFYYDDLNNELLSIMHLIKKDSVSNYSVIIPSDINLLKISLSNTPLHLYPRNEFKANFK